ncbi:LexA family transcriptional regulator [Brevibacillus laterosporus]|uniref:Peptidase S24/S26A/S26B/S26C domain-containing protein n=1 Tax=Brevibacillus laterosporus TaxID=1465 RepID=A0AAP8QD37_BRELA|nr:LexA family transcriptional regulator [Brevibacillus laterosporus]MED1911018.1 LexA family transcriptional regulator [Brevibacillus laterosporus]PPB02432.1 hypothetical protein C4A77_11945 [Brevibacillus laterosporus]
MNYYETLSELIKSSGLTLKEIAEKCRELGVKIDPSYISKLQTKKQPPASEEINRALAQVCGGDIDNLVFLGYFEKNPENIKLFIERSIEQFKEATKLLLSMQIPKEKLSLAQQQFDALSPVIFVNQVAQQDPKKLEDTENNLLEKIVNSISEIRMIDDSMEPKIPLNSLLDIDKVGEIKNGDYVLLELEGKITTVRRYVCIEDKVVLISENPYYQSYELNMTETKILGKVKSVTLKIDI